MTHLLRVSGAMARPPARETQGVSWTRLLKALVRALAALRIDVFNRCDEDLARDELIETAGGLYSTADMDVVYLPFLLQAARTDDKSGRVRTI